LIESDHLSQKQGEEFEECSRLTERFPKMLHQEMVFNFDTTLQVKILSSLGIFNSKRQNPISNDDLEHIKKVSFGFKRIIFIIHRGR
jgi:hypothetical protein